MSEATLLCAGLKYASFNIMVYSSPFNIFIPLGCQEPVKRYEKSIRVLPRRPRRVLISITPLAPREPQIAVAAASFKTSMLWMSSGLTESKRANCSLLSISWRSMSVVL